ncbi:Uncharacterised protein [Mycobacteroides abscessus subsp. abscessus]|nr:Uncharacterised protein [Mycobacteroides abscessus subsp. abscessus]
MDSVGHRGQPDRAGKTDQVGRDGHAHFMTPALQLSPNSNGRFDIAASAITCHGKFHDGIDLPDI